MNFSAKPKEIGPKRVSRIFLAHENAMVRQGIRFLIEEQQDLELCGESEGGGEVLDAVVRAAPDAVIVDVVSGHGSGLKLIREIHSRLPDTAILVVTMEDERIYGERCLRAGASGYVMKPRTIEEVIRALRIVIKGRIYLSDALADYILSRRVGSVESDAEDPVAKLSDRELEIFRLIGAWKGTREIAEDLRLSVKTVEYYREQIKKKLGLRTATDLIQAATEWTRNKSTEEPTRERGRSGIRRSNEW